MQVKNYKNEHDPLRTDILENMSDICKQLFYSLKSFTLNILFKYISYNSIQLDNF